MKKNRTILLREDFSYPPVFKPGKDTIEIEKEFQAFCEKENLKQIYKFKVKTKEKNKPSY